MAKVLTRSSPRTGTALEYCRTCGIKLTKDNTYPSDNKRYMCKDCRKNYGRQLYAVNKEYYQDYHRRYMENHRQRDKKLQRKKQILNFKGKFEFCPVCGDHFLNWHGISTHIATKHPDKQYCFVCHQLIADTEVTRCKSNGYRLNLHRACEIEHNRKRNLYYKHLHPEEKRRKIIQRKEKSQQRKKELYTLLGNKCAQCGFSNPLALEIDHVNNDGHLERTNNHTLKRSCAINYKKVLEKVKNGSTDYQILCANCNTIKARLYNNQRRIV